MSWCKCTLKVMRGSTKNQLNISTDNALHPTDTNADNHTLAMALANTSKSAKFPKLSTPSKRHNNAHAHSQITVAGQRASNLGGDTRRGMDMIEG
jgi:hypothetical protein